MELSKSNCFQYTDAQLVVSIVFRNPMNRYLIPNCRIAVNKTALSERGLRIEVESNALSCQLYCNSNGTINIENILEG